MRLPHRLGDRPSGRDLDLAGGLQRAQLGRAFDSGVPPDAVSR